MYYCIKGIPDFQKEFYWDQFSSSWSTKIHLNLKGSLRLGHRILGALPILSIVRLGNNYLSAFLKQISKTFTQFFMTENMLSFKEAWLERFVVFSTARLKDKANLFIRYFFEVFYFLILSVVIVVIESFLKWFFWNFSSN